MNSRINRTYKDRLFVFLFRREERKEWTLELYNAVNGTHYTDPDDLSFNTLENIIYIKMKNDVSFIVGNSISIYEHQASYNPNMPLRMLLYLSELYNKEIRREEESLYSHSLIRLKQPDFVVFYNGKEKDEDMTILKLSDSFVQKEELCIELKVRMININFGHNRDLLMACRPLYEYSYLIEEIRRNQEHCADIEEAADSAIIKLPDDFMIKSILEINRVEVMDMILEEYDEEREKRIIERKTREAEAEIAKMKEQNSLLINEISELKDENTGLKDKITELNRKISELQANR